MATEVRAGDVCSEWFGFIPGHVLCEMKVRVRILTDLAGRVHCDVGKNCLGCCVSCVKIRFLFASMQGKVFRMRVLLVSICLSLKLLLERVFTSSTNCLAGKGLTVDSSIRSVLAVLFFQCYKCVCTVAPIKVKI